MDELKFPLSNVQMELFKICSTNLSDTDIEELKTVLAQFYAAKAIQHVNKIWDTRGLTDTHMEALLNTKS